MTSQQPDAEHAPLTSPAAAGSGPTGHDKAVDAACVAWIDHEQTNWWDASRPRARRCRCGQTFTAWSLWAEHHWDELVAAVRASDRAALAAGDTNVAEALGLTVDLDDLTARWRRFVTDWTEAP